MRFPWLPALLALAALGARPAPAGSAPLTRNLTFLANVNEYPAPDPNGNGYSACWSYIHGDGREYALLGTANGTAIYNVTNPSAPYRVALIPGPFSIWREIKSYRNWIYIVTEGTGTGQGLQIVRMTNPESPLLVNSYTTNFVRSHTVAIDTARAILVCNGTNDATGHATGMRILSIASPENPVEIGRWPTGALPVADADYIHDCVPVGGVLYGASIYSGLAHTWDFSNPATPILQHTWTYPGAFTHNIWPTADGKTIYVTDETNGEPLKVFDVNDPSNPLLVNGVTSNPKAIVHNAHVYNGELYLANYTEGIRALDISDPHHPAEFGEADSYFGPSGGFAGVWEVCPFFPSGIVIASDRQTGLYVYRPNRNYGILRVKVQYNDGSPAVGVQVNLTTQGDSLVTPADGIVQFAPSPGAHTVVAKQYGLYEQSASKLVSAGQHVSVVLVVRARPTVNFSGTVRNAATGGPLADAEVILDAPQLSPAHSDATGHYSLGSVYANSYHLHVGRPGFMPIDTDVTLNSAFSGQDFQLVPAPTYDDLEFGAGWVAGAPGDDATSGIWVRAEPVGTGLAAVAAATPVPLEVPECCRGTLACTGQCQPLRTSEAQGAIPGDVQPEEDRTPAPGVWCFVTGQANFPNNIDESDVDGGRTSLTSPAWNLTGMSQPRIAYWRWFYSNGGTDDWTAVQISNDNGTTWTAVDTLFGPATEKWREHTIRVNQFVAPTSQVRVRFVTADLGAPSIVEGAIDDITVFDGANAVIGTPPAAAPARLAITPRPNPSRGTVAIELAVPVAAPIEVAIFDVNGRKVRALERAFAPAGRRTLHWDGRDDRGDRTSAGLYFARAVVGGQSLEARIVRVE